MFIPYLEHINSVLIVAVVSAAYIVVASFQFELSFCIYLLTIQNLLCSLLQFCFHHFGFHQLPRFLGWRYLLPSVGLFGAAYAYEYITWTPRSREKKLRTQFLRHMRAKLGTQIKATSNSYTGQMKNSLGLLLDSLHGRLEVTQQELNVQIAQLTKEQTKYSQLQDRAKKLR